MYRKRVQKYKKYCNKNIATILTTSAHLLKRDNEVFENAGNGIVKVKNTKTNTIVESYLAISIKSEALNCNPNHERFRISIDKDSPIGHHIKNGDFNSGLLIHYELYDHVKYLGKSICEKISDYLNNKTQYSRKTFWDETLSCSDKRGNGLIDYICVNPQLAIDVM